MNDDCSLNPSEAVATDVSMSHGTPHRGGAPIPAYLRETYWWAYLHPRGVRVFERDWLVNLILWGTIHRLTRAVLDEIGTAPGLSVLQMACVYGRFSERLAGQLAASGGRLEMLDIAPIQLANARRKLKGRRNVRYHRMDASRLSLPSESYDATVLFFLLHEQPDAVRRRTLEQAIRVTRPGGKVIVVDYHGPSRFNPMRYLMHPVLNWLEPYALDLWRHPLKAFLPRGSEPSDTATRLYFGSLYQKTVLRIPG
ncbi:MAG: rhodoquinone biosynthesis methyltransferase RquA [Xanthomonadales bacterium]|nr:rhodoquinone biosynthesis methyltransferase RquA [Xanthomonadales bacterium]